MRAWLIVFVFVFVSVEVSGSSYVNPVLEKDFPDPTILKVSESSYYVYATQGSGLKLQAANSTDLVHWNYLGEVLPVSPKWASKSTRFWAPDVQKHNDKFVMYFAATSDSTTFMCIGAAFASDPSGPFIALDTPLVCDKNFIAIDPKSFDDPITGKIYLYWGSDFSPIKVQELATDRVSFAPNSSAIPLIYPQNLPYKHLVEGAWLHQKNGWYYLFFSGDNCCGPTANYAVMIARSKSITGPFEEGPNYVVILNQRWNAPGHNSVVTDSSGQDWMYYHAIDKASGNPYTRNLLMDKILYDSNGWPYVSGGTPSITPQQGPII